MSQNVQGDSRKGADEGAGSERGRGPLSIPFAPDRYVWDEARRLVTDKNVRVESLALCAAQDPVLVIELLRQANAMYVSAGRAAITSAKTAIVRLGSELVVELLEEIHTRPQIDNPDVSHWFEHHRNRCKRAAIVSRMLGEAVAKNYVEDCHSAGLLMFVGEMLAVAHFREVYVSLAQELTGTGIKYRLVQDHGFDAEKMGVKYLHRNGIPEALLFALDVDSQPRQPDRAILKPVVWAASEMVDAFDNNRWEKFAPGKTLPPKSNLRLLRVSEQQYLKLYERASEYLFSSRLLEEKRKRESSLAAAPEPPPVVLDNKESLLQSEIHDLLKRRDLPAEEAEPEKSVKPSPGATQTVTVAQAPLSADSQDQFSLRATTKTEPKVARKEAPINMIAPPPLVSSRGQKAVEALTNVMKAAEKSEDLLTAILSKLVDGGPFERAALIVVSKDRRQAIVVCSRGPIGNGQRLDLDDPLSPLAQCFSRVQSFGNKGSQNSPFGCRSYALSPIDADHDTPVALYADCGDEGSIAFDARRVFRTVVDLLNERLPTLPGGIPIEVDIG